MKSVQNQLELAEILNSRVALSHIESRQNRDHAVHEQRWSGGVVHRTQNIWQMSLQDRRIDSSRFSFSNSRAASRQRRNFLAFFDSGDTFSEPLHLVNQIPTYCEGQPRRLGMNALAHH